LSLPRKQEREIQKEISNSFTISSIVSGFSYDEDIATKRYTEQSNIIRNIVRLIAECDTEKIRRVGFATLKNLRNKSSNDAQMIYAKLNTVLKTLSTKVWADKDISDDIAIITDVVEKQLIEMTSWDKYKQEVLSQELEWSPSHTSEKFWRESVVKFSENDFRLVGVLVELLNSKKPTVQAIACHDLGEFSRFHPRGKRFIQEHQIHTKVMLLLNQAGDEEVQKTLSSASRRSWSPTGPS